MGSRFKSLLVSCALLPVVCLGQGTVFPPPDADLGDALVLPEEGEAGFTNRKALSGGMIEDLVDFALIEAGPASGSTNLLRFAWWSWTAPADGVVTLSGTADFHAKVQAFQGPELAQLERIGRCAIQPPGSTRPAPSEIRLVVSPGQIVHIAVSSVSEGSLLLAVDFTSRMLLNPPNDAFFRPHEPVLLELGPPRSELDAPLISVALAVRSGIPLENNGIWQTFVHSEPPYESIIANLPPDLYIATARLSNSAGRAMLSVPALFRVTPENDDFADAREVHELPYSEVFRFSGATEELGEPVLPGQQRPESLWWRWSAPRDGVVQARSWGALGVFAGESLNELAPVGSGNGNSVRLTVSAGEIYIFKSAPAQSNSVPPWPSLGPTVIVKQWGSTPPQYEGAFSLLWAPDNDSFSGRKILIGPAVSDEAILGAASREPDEPAITGEKTLWWSWTAPADGNAILRFTTQSSIIASVWQGDEPATLQPITHRTFTPSGGWFPVEPFPVFFSVREGETYHIAFGTHSSEAAASFTLDLCSVQVISPAAGERLFGPTDLTVRLTAPRPEIDGDSGPVTVWLVGNSGTFPMLFAITAMAEPAGDGLLEAVFTAVQADSYTVYASFTNAFGRRLDSEQRIFWISPDHDDFSTARIVTSFPYADSYRLSGATGEDGEPELPSQANTASVWWRWTPGFDGVAVVRASHLVGAFVGESLEALQATGTATPGVLRLPVSAGTTYYFKVAPQSGAMAGVAGVLVINPVLANDDFEHQIGLGSGRRWMIPVLTVPPTLEPGESVHLLDSRPVGSYWWSWTAPADGLLLIRENVKESWQARGLAGTFTGDAVDSLALREPLETGSFPSHIHAVRVAANELLRLALNAGHVSGTNLSWFRLDFVPDPPMGGAAICRVWHDELAVVVNAPATERAILEEGSSLATWWERETFEMDAPGILYRHFQFSPLEQKSFFRWRWDEISP